MQKSFFGWPSGGLRHAALAMVSAFALAACGGGGGGGGGSGAGGGPAGVFASGRIEGFASVIVNDIHFDHANATIRDEEGNSVGPGHLRLGMVVEVEGGPVSEVSDDDRSTATELRFSSLIRGPVTAVGADSLTVLGQTVALDARTVFEGFADGRNSVRAGDLVVVYGYLGAGSGHHAATRVEFEDNLNAYRLRGRVSGLDATAQTFRIGNATISYAGVPAGSRPALADGALVRVVLQTAQQGGNWVATALASAARTVDDMATAEIEGYVSDFQSLADFRVDGIPVDASGAQVEFDDGNSGNLADGVRVEVEGAIRNGVLVARKVDFEDRDDDDDDDFEVRGTIQSLDTTAQAFVVQGVTVEYAAAQFSGGTQADLANGARVEVEGRLSANGAALRAQSVEFRN
ncbi:hypothetical protein IS481_13035 [Caldimonas thermodepolymerans]|jgi:hypothetical protein|uniref:DUF5666 domain-containing protein n=1 Tax=Caldimonas thermodepolymerans TaxID=215580 RepID=UPI000E2C0753|nr:DUF5666 domain-containing protein [Caldimonas thermodepolymerans]QPC30678.1 hypothetical protein IS481_13035 [Caldimonas thermodepolymerans]RDI02713.1 hypothetical protein DES46_102140 [Caldimonas thermodepolymerans]UZG43413.1 DUF5666 domain-containing protein [Caldimonas thermodepolymerans]